MNEARLELEIEIDGTDKVARGLDHVARSADKVKDMAEFHGGMSQSAEAGNKLQATLRGVAQGMTSFRMAASGIGSILRGNVITGFSQLASSARLAWGVVTGLGGAVAAVVAGGVGIGVLAANFREIYLADKNRGKRLAAAGDAVAGDKWSFDKAVAEAGGKDADSAFYKKVEGIAASGDRNVAVLELSAQQSILDEKKRQYAQFQQWKQEHEFLGWTKQTKSDRDSAEKQFTEEAQQAAARVKLLEDTLKEINHNNALAYAADIQAAREAAKKKEQVVSDEIAAAKARLESIGAQASEYSVSKMSPTDRLAYEKKRLSGLEGKANPTLDDLALLTPQRQRVDAAQALVDAENERTAILERQKKLEEDLLQKQREAERELVASDAAARDRAAADAAASAEEDRRRNAAARAALNGERNLGDSFGVEVPDGWKIVDGGRKRRTLAGGRASQWFAQRNKDIATASGGAFVTTEMGRPMMDTSGANKGVDRTNALLESIEKKLS